MSITLTLQKTGDERRPASVLASESDERPASAPLASAIAVFRRRVTPTRLTRVGGKNVIEARIHSLGFFSATTHGS